MAPIAGSLTVGLAALLLATGGYVKLIDKASFRRSLDNVPALRSTSSFISSVVPPVEILTAALLLLAQPIRGAIAAAAALYAGFALVSIIGPGGACGCGPFVPARRGVRVWLTATISVLLTFLAVTGFAPTREARLLSFGIAAVVILLLGAWKALVEGIDEHESSHLSPLQPG